ncbi:hypothetical protein DSECCO2_405700 [anaerobic digester metagenome]
MLVSVVCPMSDTRTSNRPSENLEISLFLCAFSISSVLLDNKSWNLFSYSAILVCNSTPPTDVANNSMLPLTTLKQCLSAKLLIIPSTPTIAPSPWNANPIFSTVGFNLSCPSGLRRASKQNNSTAFKTRTSSSSSSLFWNSRLLIRSNSERIATISLFSPKSSRSMKYFHR